MNTLLRFFICWGLIFSTAEMAFAQQAVGRSLYVKIKMRYQYPGTELVSEAGMVERVVGERGNEYLLQAPGAKTVAIPKNLVQQITAEAAAHALLAEREATSLRIQEVFLQLQAERLRAAQALAAAKGGAAPRAANPLDILEGGRIVADDGTFLGIVSRNNLNADSIANDLGQYGSNLSAKSIFNDLGRYGGDISPMSPFNELSVRPPKIITQDGKWIYLTANEFKTPRVDPQILIAWLKGN
jgi:hypothetical protein